MTMDRNAEKNIPRTKTHYYDGKLQESGQRCSILRAQPRTLCPHLEVPGLTRSHSRTIEVHYRVNMGKTHSLCERKNALKLIWTNSKVSLE